MNVQIKHDGGRELGVQAERQVSCKQRSIDMR